MAAEAGKSDESEEEDYLSMAILEPQTKQPETSIQRRRRIEREGRERGRVKSKKELAAEAAAARDAALATAMQPTSKGFQMMAKLGFKPGDRLGAASNPHALTEPVGLDVKEDRGGIGLDSEKKRKVREAAESESKRVKADEGDFRERRARELEEKRVEGQLRGAMKVAEKLDTEAQDETPDQPAPTVDGDGANMGRRKEPIQAGSVGNVNVLWRTLPRERAQHEREQRMKHDLQQSLTRNPQYDDPEEDQYDRQALGKEEQLVEEEDPELDAFNALPAAERLEKLVYYLRDTYNYCFWCKWRYPDKDLDGCPGTTEEDHD